MGTVRTARRVAVTGASGYLGRLLVRRLAQCEGMERVLRIDVRPMPGELPRDVAFVERDITTDITDILADNGIDAMAHLAFVIQPDRNAGRARRVNVDGASNVMSACAAVGVQNVLYMSSATVYGAHADNPTVLTEDFPLRPVPGFQYGEAKVEVEAILRQIERRHNNLNICILRACPVLGAEADNFVARNLASRVLVSVAGYDPPMQFLHEDDAAEIMTHCLLNGVEGTYNLGGRDCIRMSEMARIAGSRLVQVPAPLLYGATELSWRLGLQSSTPACGLDFIRYPWVVGGEKLKREHGLGARRSSEEAWKAFVSRRGDTR